MLNTIRRMPIILASLGLLMAGCSERLPAWNGGKLKIIVPEATQDATGEFERELARLFAEQLNTSLEMIPLPHDEIRKALNRHEAHLAAASLRSRRAISALHFGPSYQSVRELLVCNRNVAPSHRLTDLTAKLVGVITDSAQEIALREARKKLPDLRWEAKDHLSAQELLDQVAEGELDCAVANELQLATARNYHPNLIATFDIAPPSKLAWGFPRDVDPGLVKQVRAFFARIQQDGTLRRLLDRFYGHSERLASMDAAAFIQRSSTVLPGYRHLFQEAGMLTGADWRLLASLSYQESHWEPLATSFTNVRGMMMLTEETADLMKVQNRLDPRESIVAGARYLAMIKERMPNHIPEPDRTWMALAAYNQGYGHLEDARVLTARSGFDPDSWADVKKWMPLLNQPDYYKALKHGYARGGEAVILVENIRSYYDMLKRLEPEQLPDGTQMAAYQLAESLKDLLH